MINLKVLKCFVKTLSSYKMNSDRDINSKLGDVTTALSDIVSSLRTATGTTSSVGELDRARDAEWQLAYLNYSTVHRQLEIH